MTTPDLLAYINDTPALLSLLYDLGLMPEQVISGINQHKKMQMAQIANAWRKHTDEISAYECTIEKLRDQLATLQATPR